MNNRTLLIDLQYFPSVDYVSSLIGRSNIVFAEYVSFRKMTFRNRTMISGANGLINLTVPVNGGRDVKEKMNEVKIDNSQNWRTRHLRAIISSYNRSPYFEFFSDSLTSLFESKTEKLQDWNLACLDWLIENCGLEIQYSVLNEPPTQDSQLEFDDLRDHFFPKLMKNRTSSILPYRQVFEERFGFIPGLSILDFLFCAGPAAVRNLGKNDA